ncbi:TIGR03067 domain-containing protein [Stieleria mannarensis]|uniref:TIGR03067 domain-containing protein n=1 Tax=Stieleria mannarensis TaxID=2755585 RepID=UPI0015FFFA09|nr:TIGR03067 domain-containing protein [Rhodopirellula sp. JC639]
MNFSIRMFAFLLLGSLFAVPVAAAADKSAEEEATSSKPAAESTTETITDKLQGRWEVVEGVNQGRPLTEAEVAGTYVTITINRIVTYDRDDRQRFRAVFRVDSSTDPVQITMTSVPKLARPSTLDPPPKPDKAVAPGILRFDNEHQWTLCYAIGDSKRPTEFESPKGSKNMLMTLRRRPGDPVPDVRATDPK